MKAPTEANRVLATIAPAPLPGGVVLPDGELEACPPAPLALAMVMNEAKFLSEVSTELMAKTMPLAQ